MFKLAGLKPFNDWGGGAVEPAAWILGGDLNLGENTIRNEMKRHQPPKGDERLVQTLDAGSFAKRHGNLALTQHVKTFQKTSLIGRDYGGISDAHNMVVVVAKKYGGERDGGASEPTGPTGPLRRCRARAYWSRRPP